MNKKRIFKPIAALLAAAILLLPACTAEDSEALYTDDGQLTVTTDTRALTDNAEIQMKITIDGTSTNYTAELATNSGALIFSGNKPTIKPGTPTLNVHACGIVQWDLDGDLDTTNDRVENMFVIHKNTATPVVWSATGPSIELRLAAASSLIRLTVKDSDGKPISTDGATMPSANNCAWGFDTYDGTVVAGTGTPTFTATGLQQILPATIAAGKVLFKVGTKNIYAMKEYVFKPGVEYTFNVAITTSGEAVLEGFSVKEMEEGDDLGNVMLIRTIEDLRAFRTRVNNGEIGLRALQTADIEMEDQDKTGEDGKGWVPIGKEGSGKEFTGIYDGDGHSITGLTISTVTHVQGLFACTNGAKLMNILLKEVDITAGGNTGALVGLAKDDIANQLIIGCGSTGKIAGNASWVAGLVGNNAGTIVACYTTADVTIPNPTVATNGGLVGKNTGTIAFCYAMGNVKGVMNVGGLVGDNENGSIVSCYATGKITFSNSKGGSLVGTNKNGTISYSHAPIGSSTADYFSGGYAETGTGSSSAWNPDDPSANGNRTAGTASATVRACPDTEEYAGYKASTAWKTTGDNPELTWQ